MIIQVKKAFGFSANGFTVQQYVEGEIADVGEECAATALSEGWATEVQPEDLAKAQAAHEKLVKAAEKAEAAADKAETDAAAARASAIVARERANLAIVGVAAESAAADLAD